MASTPMDIDGPDASANGTPSTSLNITRTLGAMASTSALTDVIANFRPTKVVPRSSEALGQTELPCAPRSSTKPIMIVAASVLPKIPPRLPYTRPSSSPKESILASAYMPKAPTCPVLGEGDILSNTSQLFKREDQPHILSLDYDDPGELLMTSESDETIQIYKVRDGRHDKQLLSKKYGVKLAKFTHASSSIIYASTKVNDAIRYLTTHDNAFVRYFDGHEGAVTCLAMHPGSDDFVSCSKDNTVRLWNASTRNATGVLHLNTPYLSAFDPSGQVFAVGSPASGTILLYDHRNFDKAPFTTIDVHVNCSSADPTHTLKGWTKLEFSNDGRHILLGTKGQGHFLLDSFKGTLKAFLRKPNGGGSNRLAAGEGPLEGRHESSGDCCFTPDGRYVLSGSGKQLLTWDTLGQPDGDKVLEPMNALEDDGRQAAVLAFNPRFNFFATADQGVVFWVPDPHA